MTSRASGKGKRPIPNEVACFDPGPHTGYARFQGKRLYSTRTIDLSSSTAEMVYGQVQTLISLLSPGAVVVVENYHTVGPLGKDGLATIKMLGFIEGEALVSGHECFVQMPSMKKPWLEGATEVTRARGGTRHERDAVAHGYAWFAMNVGSDESGPQETKAE